jgi:arsenate reductase
MRRRVSARPRRPAQIPDPRDMTPDEFRGVRDLIEQKVVELLATLKSTP